MVLSNYDQVVVVSDTNEDEWSYGNEKNIMSGRTRAIVHNG